VIQDENTGKNVLKEVGEEMPIEGAIEAKIEFSPDGKFLALIASKSTLRIYQLWEEGDDWENSLEEFVMSLNSQ
jgi:hypothetical protein